MNDARTPGDDSNQTLDQTFIGRREPEQVGVVIAGRYKLLEAIGEGGMGTVWAAEQTQPVRRKVALKLIKAGMDSRSVLARFDAERQALAVMDHPNVAKVLDGGLTESGRPFFVMEYVKGVPITEYCDTARLSVSDRLTLFADVCQAVQHAHQKGIIHRDLKPSNILVTTYDDKPVPKIIDFGLAKAMHQSLTDKTLHTAHETVLGTPLYMAPEQAQVNNIDIDTRADIYSLGVLLYELLTGTTPLEQKRFKQAAWDEIRRIIREEEPPRPSARLSSTDSLPTLAACRHTEPAGLTKSIRGELDWIVMKALEKDRARRYETANGLAMDIHRYLTGDPVLAAPPSATYRLKKFVRRRRGPLVAASVVVLALLAGVASVVAVQVRANRDLAAKNAELADEQAKVQARFELAQRAIALFHTGVSEDMLLKNEQFKELRKKLLKQAAGFYADLEKLLAGQTDPRSRKALAAGYFQLGELTGKIGSKPEALTVHRKALAVRRELSAADNADLEACLDVARSLDKVASLLRVTGDEAGALLAFDEQRAITEKLEAENPTDDVRFLLGLSYRGIGNVHYVMAKPVEAVAAYRKALAVQQRTADANPRASDLQLTLAGGHNSLALGVLQMGKIEEGLAELRAGSVILQKLADTDPGALEVQRALSGSYNNLGAVLAGTGKTDQSIAELRKGLAIRQRIADAHPAVIEFQKDLGDSYENIGGQLSTIGKLKESIELEQKALAIYQKLADANPSLIVAQHDVALAQANLCEVFVSEKRFAEGLAAIDASLAINRKLSETYPKNTEHVINLGHDHAVRGWALIRSGQPAKAASDLRRGLELTKKGPSRFTEMRYVRARTFAQLAGLGKDANSGVTKTEAATFADQAVAALRDAIQAGWSWSDELNQPDFDALRGRDDFKKLVAELQEKAKPKAK